MSLFDLPGVFLPSVLLSCLLLTLVLTLALLKVLKNLYLYNHFRLTPLSLSKALPQPSLSALLQTFLPLYGIWKFHRPQFDLPPAAHLFLASVHLSLLWAANVAVGRVEEEFQTANAVIAAAVASSLAVGMTYIFHTRYLSSFNSTVCPDAQSQSRTEAVNHSPSRPQDLSSFIDTSLAPVTLKHTHPSTEPDYSNPPDGVKLEAILLMVVATTVGVNFWSIGMHFSVSRGEIGVGLVLQWMFGAAVDVGFRCGFCGVMRVLRVGTQTEAKFWSVDYGISSQDLGKYSRRPRIPGEEGRGESFKETFFQDQMSQTPPITTPRPAKRKSSLFSSILPATPEETANQDCGRNVNYAFGCDEEANYEGLKLSPGKFTSKRSSPNRREAAEISEEEGQVSVTSQETMPEVPHNMFSPVETPRDYSGIHFYRTPERPFFQSPESSPPKPVLPAKNPDFEILLRAVSLSSSESEPDSPHKLPQSQSEFSDNTFCCVAPPAIDTDSQADSVPDENIDEVLLTEWRETKQEDSSQELYMVEFLPGGIMTKEEVARSQYDWEKRRTEEMRSIFTPASENYRGKSVERELSESQGGVLWADSPTKKRSAKVAPQYCDEGRPATDAPLRDRTNTPIHPPPPKPFVDSEDTPPSGECGSLPASEADQINAKYEQISEMLSKDNFRRRRFRPQEIARQEKSVSPYRGWRLAQQLVEEPAAAASREASSTGQSSILDTLSQIYINSRPPIHLRSSSQQRSSRGRSHL